MSHVINHSLSLNLYFILFVFGLCYFFVNFEGGG